MDVDAMEIRLLLTGPEDERSLDECLGGVFDDKSHIIRLSYLMTGYERCPLTRAGATGDGEQAVTMDPEKEYYVQPSMTGLSPLRRGQRRTRKQRRRCWGVKFSHLFGSPNPFTREGGKMRTRKNNDHWTQDEMNELVIGVTNYGVGRWIDVKRSTQLKTSIRTAVHLKDKWKNLVKASRASVTSNNKVKLHEATELIVQEFKYHILDMEASEHLAKKKKRIKSIGNQSR